MALATTLVPENSGIKTLMYFVFLLLEFSEARVFCEDSNAMPWAPVGFSCPVLCASIRNAIERLIMLDYKKSVQEQLGSQKVNSRLLHEDIENINTNQHQSLRNSIHDKESKNPNKETFKKDIASNNINEKTIDIFKTLQNAKDIIRPTKNSGKSNTEFSEDYNNTTKKCWYLDKFKRSLLVGKIVRKECSRRSNFDGKFLAIMTNVLNEYADTMFKFTEEMTEILLENIFGQNTDLRNNILDVNKLLKYLRKSVDLHKSHTHVITLRSRHCLTISLPGCYCKSGYVESSGQCVKPSDCVTNNYYTKYLRRIIVN